MLEFDTDGWLLDDPRVHKFEVRPRPDANGKMFKPSGGKLARYVMQRYGGPKLVVVHGTDVVGRQGTLAMARHKAFKSKRKAGYHLLLGSGLVCQLESILKRTPHAGRSLENKKGTGVLQRAREGNVKAQGMVDMQTGKWKYPVIDGRAVGNPNAWGPGIEIENWQKLDRLNDGRVGIYREGRVIKVIQAKDRTLAVNNGWWHNFEQEDLDNLEELLGALYDGPGDIVPETVYPHSLFGVNRIDPGPLCPLEEIAHAAAFDELAWKDMAESNEGDDEDDYQEPYEGPAAHD